MGFAFRHVRTGLKILHASFFSALIGEIGRARPVVTVAVDDERIPLALLRHDVGSPERGLADKEVLIAGGSNPLTPTSFINKLANRFRSFDRRASATQVHGVHEPPLGHRRHWKRGCWGPPRREQRP